MTSSPDNITTPSHPALILSVSLYVLPLLVGVAGNTGLVHVIVTQKTLRTAVNAYIASMAVLDLLACILLVPLRLLFYLALPSMLQAGPALCQAEVFFRSLVDAGRMLLLAAISFERYQAVAHPFKRDKASATRRAFIILGVLCGSSTVYAALLTVFLKDTVMFEFCLKETPGDSGSYVLWGGIEMYFVLPMSLITVIVIIICYVLMFRVLNTQRNKMLGHSNKKAGNKVAPVGGSVKKVKVQSDPVKVNKTQHSRCISVTNVTNVTSVSAAGRNNASAESTHPVTDLAVSPGKALQREEGSQNQSSNTQTVTEPPPSSVAPNTEAVTHRDTCATKQNVESTVLPSTNAYSLISTTPLNLIVPKAPTPVNASLLSASRIVRSKCGEREPDCADHGKSVIRDLQLSATGDRTLAAVNSPVIVPQRVETEADPPKAAEIDSSRECQTPRVSSQHSHVSTGRNSGSGLLYVISVEADPLEQHESEKLIPSYKNKEDLSSEERRVNVAQGQQATSVPPSSFHSVSKADKYLQVTNIHALNTLSPNITSLDMPVNSYSAEKAAEIKTLVMTTTASSAGDTESNTETQSSNLQASSTEASRTPDAQPSTPVKHTDTSTVAAHTESKDQEQSMKAAHTESKDQEQTVKAVKVVEADGSEHVEKVASSQNIQGDVCMFTPKNRELGRRKMEGRVAKRLVVIFLTFLLLWLPYPCAVLLLHLLHMHSHPSYSASVPQTVTDVIAVLSALSMVTAAINPVFYGLANTTIRSIITTALRKACSCCLPCKLRRCKGFV
ncbi:hypothetical protein ACOMHN_055489 [Nucella lapillus]